MGRKLGNRATSYWKGEACKRLQRVIADGPETLIQLFWSGPPDLHLWQTQPILKHMVQGPGFEKPSQYLGVCTLFHPVNLTIKNERNKCFQEDCAGIHDDLSNSMSPEGFTPLGGLFDKGSSEAILDFMWNWINLNSVLRQLNINSNLVFYFDLRP